MTHPSGLPEPEGPYPPSEEMLAEPVPRDVQEAQARRLRAAWKTPQGWRYITAVNNTEVGKWYCLTALVFMLLVLLLRCSYCRCSLGGRAWSEVRLDAALGDAAFHEGVQLGTDGGVHWRAFGDLPLYGGS